MCRNIDLWGIFIFLVNLCRVRKYFWFTWNILLVFPSQNDTFQSIYLFSFHLTKNLNIRNLGIAPFKLKMFLIIYNLGLALLLYLEPSLRWIWWSPHKDLIWHEQLWWFIMSYGTWNRLWSSAVFSARNLNNCF